MPPELEDAEEIEKIDTATDDVDVSQETEQSTPAESSTATDDKKPDAEGAISVVRDVVSKSREKAPEASSAEGVEAAGDKPGAKTPKEPDNVNYTDVPFHKHPRFKEVLGKARESEADAQRYRNVQTFIDNVGLSAEEAASTLEIGGLIKTNPVEAWKRLLPIVQNVAIAAGEMLPDDLKQQVAEGKMPREAAIEVSRSRAQVATTQARTEWDQQRSQERQAQEARQANLDAVHSWESERRVKDPNFDAKLPAIRQELERLQGLGWKPREPSAIKAQLQQAYDAVIPPRPAPAPRAAVKPVTGGQVTASVKPEVTSTVDAIRAVVARRQG